MVAFAKYWYNIKMEENNLTQKQKTSILYRKIPPLMKMIFFLVVGIGLGYFISAPSEEIVTEDQNSSTYGVSEKNCNVAGINLHGTIMTYIPFHADGDANFDYDTVGSEDILWSVNNANEDPNIKALIVEVDSYGGSPVAGEEISIAIKNSTKPVFGFIRENGLSAAYWAISSADRIWASKNSNVGSIGVTQSYLSYSEKNKKEGYLYEQLSSGKFKDSGTPDLSLTKEEKDLFMRDINIVYQNFMEAVSNNRNILIEDVKKFSDGSAVLGDKAKELGMIDEIGGINEVEKYIEEKIGEKVEICWE